MTVPTLFKLSDAAKVLGPGAPCEDTLRSEVKAGRLRAKRIGRCLRVTDVELTRWALDTSSPSAVTSLGVRSDTNAAITAEGVPAT